MTKQYDKWHEAEQLAPGTWRISEGHGINCYLLEGDERALLIDTGIGVGELGAVVSDLTGLPVTVVLTHKHCDHAGGRGWFRSRTHVHEADMSLSGQLTSCRPAALLLSKSWATGRDYPRQPYHPDYTAMTEGATFELGGRDVTVIHTPGHTRGSVTFLDRSQRLMFTGDDVLDDTWLWLPGAMSVEEWLSGARRILKLCERYTPLTGHGDGRIEPDFICRLVEAGEQLVSETRHNAVFSKKASYADENGVNLISYRTGNVRAGR